VEAGDEDAAWLGDAVEMWLGGVQWEGAVGLAQNWRADLAGPSAIGPLPSFSDITLPRRSGSAPKP
jgi:hypothetical protein